MTFNNQETFIVVIKIVWILFSCFHQLQPAFQIMNISNLEIKLLGILMSTSQSTKHKYIIYTFFFRKA